MAAQKTSAINAASAKTATITACPGWLRCPPDTFGKEWSFTGGGIHSISTMVADDEVAEQVDVKPAAVGGAALSDAIGVQKHPVTGFHLLGVDGQASSLWGSVL